jgi:hypothetical protein
MEVMREKTVAARGYAMAGTARISDSTAVTEPIPCE